MAICKSCGKPLILNGGKCLYCGASPSSNTPKKGIKPSKPVFPSIRQFEVNGVTFKMILVEGGSFHFGMDIDLLNKEIESGRDYKKTFPALNVDSFYIGETIVTQSLWEAVMEERDEKIAVWDDKKAVFNPSYFKGKELPVELGSSPIAPDKTFDVFIERLNSLTGAEFRLPDNVEWEFAAKGGNKSKGYRYAGSNTLDEVGWYLGNSGERTTWLREILKPYEERDRDTHKTRPVKTKKPNELGLYDMSGNVMELVTNRFFPHGMKYRLDRKLLRGGGFHSEEEKCLAVSENRFNGVLAMEIGFRLALSLNGRQG